MAQALLPVYSIQDFQAEARQEHYFYFSSFANHLQEHLFIREPHKHNFYIVLFVTQGTGNHTIDFKTYNVQPETIFFLSPGQVHSWDLTEDADGFVVFFTPAFYLRQFPHTPLHKFPFFRGLLHKPMLLAGQPEQEELTAAFQALQQEFLGQHLMRQEMLSCLLDVLLIKLNRMYYNQTGIAEGQAKDVVLVQALEQLIEAHYAAHLPVTFYADHLHITTKQLKEICKRSLGKTTNELLQERSVLEAQRLLVHSNLTATEIAATLGYTDTAYFFRFFKKHTNSTPEQFRQANR